MNRLIKNFFYRIIHIGLFLFALFVPFPVPAVIKGPGAVDKLPSVIKAYGLKKILIVSDNIISKLPQFATLLDQLNAEGLEYFIFSNFQPNPSIENVEDACKEYLSNQCEGIIAFGGGSSMDCAKIGGALVTNKKSVKKMAGLFKLRKKIPPLFAIPTTAGSGSEVTVAAVITDKQNYTKFAIVDLKLVPKVAVLDPEVTTALPPSFTSTTGMDALTHAVEAYIGVAGTSKTNKLAEDAVVLVFNNLEAAHKNGSDILAREKMLLASYYGGAAFTKASVGYVHAIAHKLGGMYQVPHGLANAIILPYMLEYYGSSIYKKLAKLAVVAELGNADEQEKILAARFIEKVKNMNRKMGIPEHIHELKHNDIHLIAKSALNEGNPMYPVPKIMDMKECEKILGSLIKVN